MMEAVPSASPDPSAFPLHYGVVSPSIPVVQMNFEIWGMQV